MKKLSTLTAVFLVLFFCASASAHFGMVIPSDNMVAPDDARKVALALSFSHPFEGMGMTLVQPDSFVVVRDGEKTDLTGTLSPTKVMGHPSWKAAYPVKRPGAHTFVMTPVPYWEPAEDCFIIHYTKTVVAAFGDDTGWDQELGLQTRSLC